MATTAINALRYPAGSDSPNGPVQIQNLASDLDTRLVPRYATTAARATAIPTPIKGQVTYQSDVDQVQVYNGSAWVYRAGSPVIQAVSLSANWTNGNELPRAWVQPDGAVKVVGQLVNTASVSTNAYDPWITLPSGCRPAVQLARSVILYFASTLQAPEPIRADIRANGTVVLNVNGTYAASGVWTIDWTFRTVNT